MECAEEIQAAWGRHEMPIDFIGHEYEFLTAPTPSSHRSADLLLASFRRAGVGAIGTELISAIQSSIGRGRTVWGMKASDDGRPHWEFYWYDDLRGPREIAYHDVAPIFAALGGYHAASQVDERAPYVSFSFDVEQSRTPEPALSTTGSTLYFGEAADGLRSVGLSYRVALDSSLSLRNVYQTFDARQAEDLSQCARFVERSAHAQIGVTPRLPWLDQLTFETVILARKPTHDGIYFRRTKLGEVIRLPEFSLVSSDLAIDVRAMVDRFDHLYVDVGIDYAMHGADLRPNRLSLFGYL